MGQKDKHPQHPDTPNNRLEKLRLTTAFAIFIAGMALPLSGIPLFTNPHVSLSFFLAAWALSASGALTEAYKAICRKDYLNEYTLMLTASVGAFCIGEYPEAAAVMLFYSIGEMLQDQAVGKARTHIKSLLAARPQHASVLRVGKWLNVPPTNVKIGEIIEVKTGERVPIDGILLNTCAVFNTAALTGESMPHHIKAGNKVAAGMIPITQVINLQTTRLFTDSTLARLLDMVENAVALKAPTELFIRRFARIYTPVVILAACLLILIPYLYSIVESTFHYELHTWLYRALAFLVVSCPCALVISIPLSYFGGIGSASRRGIFFKGSNSLDALARINAVAFDKTGTLTSGSFCVQKVIPAPGYDAPTIIAAAATVEAKSTHPLARAVCRHAQKLCLPLPRVYQVEEMFGLGVLAHTDKGRIIVGSADLLRHHGVPIPTSQVKSPYATSIAIAINQHYAGSILLADESKADAKQAVDTLKNYGIKNLYILSGDKPDLVKALGQQIGITQCYGHLLPQDKVNLLRKIQSSASKSNCHTRSNAQYRAAFVGDGINDAPVLATAFVGIAMGGTGADLAVETADVILQTDSPMKVAQAFKLARHTRTIVNQNICGTLLMKAAVLVLSAFGCTTLWAAVFADVGVTLLAIANSLRLLKTH